MILKIVHKVIRFNKKSWLKPYIDMNAKLRRKAKNNFEKSFLKLMNNAVIILQIIILLIQVVMKKAIYLGSSLLDLSKTVMYEFWHDHVKPKYGECESLLYGYR